MYDYALGGKDNFSADREASELIRAELPAVLSAVRENRRFMRRAVRYLLSAGVRQFLDIGCGIPGRGNVHDLAHAVDPCASVVYVDHDCVAVSHYQALLSSSDTATAFQGDLRQPQEILADAERTGLIDFREPVAVLMVAVLHHVLDEEESAGIMRELIQAVAPGSHLVLSHFTPEELRPSEISLVRELGEMVGRPVAFGGGARIARLLDGLDLVEPGLVPAGEWRPDRPEQLRTGWLLAAVGRKA